VVINYIRRHQSGDKLSERRVVINYIRRHKSRKVVCRGKKKPRAPLDPYCFGSLIRIRSKVEIWDLSRLNMKPWRATGAQKRGVEAQNGGPEGLQASGRRFATP
jgi:hypothetical protein